MRRALPANPNLEHLKKQAKDFLKEFNSGNSRLYGRVQTRLPRFEGKSLKEILSTGITLHDAQYITALEYGFDNWPDLRGLVEGESESLSFPGQRMTRFCRKRTFCLFNSGVTYGCRKPLRGTLRFASKISCGLSWSASTTSTVTIDPHGLHPIPMRDGDSGTI